ncbi:MAG TPA: hypothetical protein VFZ49_02665, partial [Pyrinomonadaceae bacterium]
AALYSRDRVGRNTKTGAKFETFAQPAELETAERLALPSENFSRVPDSVVDRTTEKLHIPRS